MKTLFLTIVLMMGLNAWATPNSQSASLASTSKGFQTYTIQDGYGEYIGQGSTKIAAESDAREQCVHNQIDMYQARHGSVPDADTADLMIDACINK